MISLYNLIHIYNLFFILSFNLFGLWLRVILLCIYIVYFIKKTDSKTIFQSKIVFFYIFLIISIFSFGYISNGFQTIPNWDYYKYNKILFDIFNNPLHPSLTIEGEVFSLAYYYAIFLPTVYLAKILSLFMEINVFLLQFIFVFLNTVFISYAVYEINSEIFKQTRKHIFIVLIFVLSGLDAIFLILIPEINQGTYLINDIQNGGINWYFKPLRLQNFISYFFWLPGHTLSALIALFFIVKIESESVGQYEYKFILVPLLIFLYSTSIFVLFGFLVYLTYYLFTKNSIFTVKDLVNINSIIVILIISAFYMHDRMHSSFGMFFSKHILEFTIYKYFLFFLQEFLIFFILGLLTKQRSEYFLTILALIMLSLFGSRDFLMSGGILFLLYLIYKLSINYQKSLFLIKNKLFLILLTVPLILNIFYNLLESLDYSNAYKNNMSQIEALGSEVEILPSVLKNYVRSNKK